MRTGCANHNKIAHKVRYPAVIKEKIGKLQIVGRRVHQIKILQ